jgi:hypothetical protein
MKTLDQQLKRKECQTIRLACGNSESKSLVISDDGECYCGNYCSDGIKSTKPLAIFDDSTYSYEYRFQLPKKCNDGVELAKLLENIDRHIDNEHQSSSDDE